MEVEFLGFFRCARGTFMRTEQNNQFKKERIYPLQKKRVLDFESSKHNKVSNNGNLKLNTKAFRLVLPFIASILYSLFCKSINYKQVQAQPIQDTG